MRFPQSLFIVSLILLTISCSKDKDSNNEIDPNDTISSFNPLPTNLMKVYKDSLLVTEYYYCEDWLIKKCTYKSDGSIYDSISYHYDNNKFIDYTIEYNSYSNQTDTNNYICDLSGNIIYYENKAYGFEFNISYNSLNQINEVEWIEEYGHCCTETYDYDNRGNIIHAYFTNPAGFDTDSFQYDNYTNPLKNFWMSCRAPDPEFISQSNILWGKSHSEDYSDWFDEVDVVVTINEWEWRNEYEYNEDELPISVVKYDLTNNDTTTYQFEYLIL